MAKNIRYLPSNAVANATGEDGKHIKRSFAEQLPIVFGFKHLDLSRGKFTCKNGSGDSIIKVLKCLCLFSSYNEMQMGQTKNYHPLDDATISRNGFDDLIDKSPRSKLHQMGKKRTPERIIGFFESNPSYVFQVCILDLNHQAYPEH